MCIRDRISRKALLKGVDFSYIPNLTIRGEDRFFCIRASVLGIGLFVDTSYPAYHIYRPSDLKTVPYYTKEKDSAVSESDAVKHHKQRIVLSMTVRNEVGRYLAVSYTHLDVYKRQRRSCPKRRGLCLSERCISGISSLRISP